MLVGTETLPHHGWFMFSLEILEGAWWIYNIELWHSACLPNQHVDNIWVNHRCNLYETLSNSRSSILWVPGQLNMMTWTLGDQFSGQPCVSRIPWCFFINGKGNTLISLNPYPVSLKFLMSSRGIFPTTPVQSPGHFLNYVSLFCKCTLFG